MRDLTIAITAASYSGNKGAAAMLQSSISQLKEIYGEQLKIRLMSVYPSEDRLQCPHDCVSIVPAQPQRIVFAAFPCAVLYRVFSWCPPIRALLLHSPVLNAYAGTDLVIDEAGIAFCDSRGFVMNTYAFMCAAVPLLMGVPLVKYSQAMGPFHNGYNRFLAKWILPKAELVIARGRLTKEHLYAAGIKDNVRMCADGAFTMPQNAAIAKQVLNICKKAGFSHTVGLSISSVVDRRCAGAGIDYRGIMVKFIFYLNKRGYQVYMFANAARMHSKRPRNNDLMIGDAIARAYRRKCRHRAAGAEKAGQKRHAGPKDRGLIWEHREMEAEELRAYIGQCELVIASRFHAMVFALSQKVPVMLVGWSHKYREVMEQFGLGEYAADYKQLNVQLLCSSFANLEAHQEEIKEKIEAHLPDVKSSSRQNIQYIAEIIDCILEKDRMPEKDHIFEKDHMLKKDCMLEKDHILGKDHMLEKDRMPEKNHMLEKDHMLEKGRMLQKKHSVDKKCNHVIDLDQPDAYMGPYLSCCMGYAAAARIRENAASGGMVTALLCSLLKNNEIDGAWVVKTAFQDDGRLSYHTYIARTPKQVCEASSSVYMQIPMMKHIDQPRRFDGRLAVVLTPCMMHAFCRILEKDEALNAKIVLKIGLFCSGAHKTEAAEFALDKCRIPRAGAERLYFRRGHWRGKSSVL